MNTLKIAVIICVSSLMIVGGVLLLNLLFGDIGFIVGMFVGPFVSFYVMSSLSHKYA